MSDTYLSLLKAVVTKLKADGLASGRVYTQVPQQETFPYLVVSIASGDYSTKTFTGMDHTIQISIYSRASSPLEAATARDALYTSLNRNEGALSLDSGTLSHIHYNGVGDILKDVDGVTWVALSQFRAVVT